MRFGGERHNFDFSSFLKLSELPEIGKISENQLKFGPNMWKLYVEFEKEIFWEIPGHQVFPILKWLSTLLIKGSFFFSRSEYLTASSCLYMSYSRKKRK